MSSNVENLNLLTIREAIPGDAPQIARLVNAAYRPHPGAEGWTHESDIVAGERTSTQQVEEALGSSVVFVGLRGSAIVACIQVARKGIEAHIGMLAVEPSLQGAGFGDAMLAHAEAYALSSFGAEQFVLVVVSDRTELIEFYRRRGYEDSGQRLPYPIGRGVGTPRNGLLDLAVLRKRANTREVSS